MGMNNAHMNDEQIKNAWQQWQQANPAKAAELTKTFTDIACTGPWKRAQGWLAKQIASELQIDAARAWLCVLRA